MQVWCGSTHTNVQGRTGKHSFDRLAYAFLYVPGRSHAYLCVYRRTGKHGSVQESTFFDVSLCVPGRTWEFMCVLRRSCAYCSKYAEILEHLIVLNRSKFKVVDPDEAMSWSISEAATHPIVR